MDSNTIVYIDNNELKEFSNGKDAVCYGFSYEWEGENVIHFHTKSILHSFGKQATVLFTKEKDVFNTNQDYPYVVYVRKCDDSYTPYIYKKNGETWVEIETQYIPAKEELYSRNKGLLELDILENKKVVIIGLGSGGSQISIELAKAGVGKFSLFDFDRVELKNLARHACTTRDLGRLKTDAVSDLIVGKNPYAIVEKFNVDINHNLQLLEEQIKVSDLIICATDNHKSRYIISDILARNKKTGIYGGVISRAEGGLAFIQRPGAACWTCLKSVFDFQDIILDGDSSLPPVYMSNEDKNAIQIGLSADIEPINNMIVKLALVELSRGAQSGISSLENELVFNFYLWANRREIAYKGWGNFSNAGKKPTILRWYGGNIMKDEQCPTCGTKDIDLDVDETLLSSVNLPDKRKMS